MAIEATSSTQSASIDKMSEIANLLVGIDDDEVTNNEPEDQDLEEGSTQTDESNEEQEESEETSNEETQEGDESDLSWGKVLGIDDSKIALSDDGEVIGINVKVDGKIDTVPVNELIAGYQFNKSNTNKAQTLAAERKEFDEIRDTIATEYTQKLEAVNKLTAHLESNLLKDFQNINWEQLRYTNPAEYAALIQDFQLKSSEIEQVKNAIQQESTQEQQVWQQKSQAQMNEYLKQQVEKVIEKNPTWAKPEVFKKALTEIETFIEEAYGFDKNDFANIQDARIFEVLKDAKAYREGKKFAEKKLTTPIPKFQKSNGVPVKKKSKLEILTAKAKVEKNSTKRRELQTEAMAEILLGGMK